MKRNKSEVKWWRSMSWLGAVITMGCIGPFPDGPDEGQGDDGPSGSVTTEVSGASTQGETTPTVSGEATWTSQPDPSATATVSGTATCGDCGDDDGTAGVSVCGVDVVHDPGWNTLYVCGCEACNVEFSNVVPESGEALLSACECICAEVGCGGSISGGATTEEPDDTGDNNQTGTASSPTGDEDTSPTGEDDTSPGDDDGPTDSGDGGAGEGTESTG